MVHWVYVLQSSDTDAIYVGETTRLYRRWHEHSTGRGGVTTSSDNYDTLIGLYNVSHNINFLDFYSCSDILHNPIGRVIWGWNTQCSKEDALQVENHITERYRIERKDFSNIKGGKYCRDNCIFDLTNVIIDRPLCKCGYPCEVNMKKDNTKIYFTCPVPDWVDYGYDIPEKCNFWKEYDPYRTMREQDELRNRQEYAIQMRKKNLAAYIEATKDD
jgi:hypothetical protein